MPRKKCAKRILPHFIQEVLIMAQKVTGIIKLQINAAKATASPPVGPLWVSTALTSLLLSRNSTHARRTWKATRSP